MMGKFAFDLRRFKGILDGFPHPGDVGALGFNNNFLWTHVDEASHTVLELIKYMVNPLCSSDFLEVAMPWTCSSLPFSSLPGLSRFFSSFLC